MVGVPKVVAYLTRNRRDDHELLTFRHAGQPDAGIQVPGGGVYDGESIFDALTREVEEESGLQSTDVTDTYQIADYTIFKTFNRQYQRRHVFWLRASRRLPDRWDHTVTGLGEDAGLVFQFEWIPLGDAKDALAAGLGDKIHILESKIHGRR